MLIRHKKASDVASHEITPESAYLNRRGFVEASGIVAASVLSDAIIHQGLAAELPASRDGAFANVKQGYRKLGPKDSPNSLEDVTSYNNFYEFGTDKGDPSEYSSSFKPLPWTVKIDGLCDHPGTLDLNDFLKPHTLEERVYRMRCVEAWSMVIPWVGISLADVVKRFEPQGKAKYIAFETVVRPLEMRGQKSYSIGGGLDWPYVEGLRLDEAMNPLAILAVGLYGKQLPNQNGAPLRLVTPWKYGFKGIKSIVRISFVENEPKSTWNITNPGEYGFYSNVNPTVDHPRWTQATERRIGDLRRRETLMFNGYEEEVGQLYAGMDLRKYF